MAESKKHFYVVLKGRAPGIFTRWSGSGGAEEQVKGFAGAVFRGFATREEAEYYQRTGGRLLPPAGASAPAPLFPPTAARQPSAPARQPRGPASHEPDLAAGKVVVFTDGASTGNPGPGGYGVVILSGERRQELSGGYRCTTNNRMEVMGVIIALQALPPGAQVVLYSDSRYLVNAIQLGWARRWRANGWMRKADSPAENADLWARLLELLERYPVEFRWVKGHASHPENERCDRLAVAAARRPNLPPDAGYRGRC